MSTLTVMVAFISGALVFLNSIIKVPVITAISQGVRQWAVILAAFATGLGVINLTMVQYGALKRSGRKVADVVNASSLLTIMWFMITVGVFSGTSHPAYNFVFEYMLKPLSASGFAMLAFFISSAAYRAFRIRNLDAALLLLSGAIVMIANVPVGTLIWPGSVKVASWIMNVINGAAMKGIVIGASLGAIATSLKVLVGLDRSYFRG